MQYAQKCYHAPVWVTFCKHSYQKHFFLFRSLLSVYLFPASNRSFIHSLSLARAKIYYTNKTNTRTHTHFSFSCFFSNDADAFAATILILMRILHLALAWNHISQIRCVLLDDAVASTLLPFVPCNMHTLCVLLPPNGKHIHRRILKENEKWINRKWLLFV